MKNLKMLAVATVTVGLYSGSASAQALAPAADSCVAKLNYPANLTLPSLESWATDSFVFSGTAETECKLVKELTGYFDMLQAGMAAGSPDKKKMRGTHSKGICFDGTFQSNLSSTLKESQKKTLLSSMVFSSNEPMAARFRFANAASKIAPDWKADVRAISMKIDLPTGARQDFAFNNVPRFQIDTLDNFVKLMDMQIAIAAGKIKVDPKTGAPALGDLFSYFRNKYDSVSAGVYLSRLNNIKSMAQADQKFHGSLADQNYFSTTAFTMGEDEGLTKQTISKVMKFGAIPCGSEVSKGRLDSSGLRNPELASEAAAKEFAEAQVRSGEAQKAENFLFDSLLAKAKREPICYDLFVQFLSETALEDSGNMVEDPSIIWNGPIHTVGRLTIKDAADQQSCDDPKNAISVFKNSVGIRALGQINRARDFVETSSWQKR